MVHGRAQVLLLLLVGLVLLWAPPAAGREQKEVLKGLKGVAVAVEVLPPELRQAGLSQESLREVMEAKLRRAGIKVFRQARPPAMSTLYLNITCMLSRTGSTLIYGINLMLYEYAYLKRDIGSVGDLKEIHAINWFKGMVGYGNQPFAPRLLKGVEDLLGLFIADYAAANSS